MTKIAVTQAIQLQEDYILQGVTDMPVLVKVLKLTCLSFSFTIYSVCLPPDPISPHSLSHEYLIFFSLGSQLRNHPSRKRTVNKAGGKSETREMKRRANAKGQMAKKSRASQSHPPRKRERQLEPRSEQIHCGGI